MKQLLIDNGQVGGFIQVVVNSMFVFNFMTFINSSVTVYDSYLKSLIPPYLGFALLAAISIGWWVVYYVFIFPSIVQYSNRQSYMHNSPIKSDFARLNERFQSLDDQISSLDKKIENLAELLRNGNKNSHADDCSHS